MQMKKSVFIASLLTCSLVFGSIGAVASTGVEKIKASLNHNIKFVLNGDNWSPKDSKGNKLSALVYDGSTYVPLRAIGEALDAEVDYDGKTSTITIDQDGSTSGIPHNDDNDDDSGSPTKEPEKTEDDEEDEEEKETEKEESKPAKPSSAKGKTFATAIPLGESVTYTDPYDNGKGFKTTATYTVSVTSAKSITRSQIEDLGFQKPEENALVDYKLVKLKVTLKNGKFISDEKGDDKFEEVNLSTFFAPKIWGVQIADENFIVGGQTWGFDGALEKEIDKATDTKRITVGESGNYTAEGLVLLPIIKGQKNTLVLQKKHYDTKEYDNSFFHFKLE
ncbi:hypothetical protein I6N90_14710 [Paenibacillus sp. GSMTC-2017]|uniref:stalk domain-containing protein n=1 Tax=Paenibacillus sp. GSMTC-2017 TaxID=2794350 RepID=UPI0018D6E751|nr:stalk domain-containing protein [Paenibacillus sp. GSMTC-2017]MBH5319055.1 hypothetical protein [Paenibacillus sp. GSMTC-2017]